MLVHFLFCFLFGEWYSDPPSALLHTDSSSFDSVKDGDGLNSVCPSSLSFLIRISQSSFFDPHLSSRFVTCLVSSPLLSNPITSYRFWAIFANRRFMNFPYTTREPLLPKYIVTTMTTATKINRVICFDAGLLYLQWQLWEVLSLEKREGEGRVLQRLPFDF